MFDVRGSRTRIICPKTNLLGEASLQLERTICQQIGGGVDEIVLDLSEVEAVDSTALSAIIASRSELARAGAKLRIINLTEPVQRVFQLTAIDELLGVEL